MKRWKPGIAILSIMLAATVGGTTMAAAQEYLPQSFEVSPTSTGPPVARLPIM